MDGHSEGSLLYVNCFSRFSLLLAVQIATLPQKGHRLLSNATLQHLIINTDKFKLQLRHISRSGKRWH